MAVPIIETFLTPYVVNILVTYVLPFLIFFSVLLLGLKISRIFGDNNIAYIILSLAFSTLVYVVNPNSVVQFISSYLIKIGIAGLVISFTGVIVFIFWALISRSVHLAATVARTDEQKLKDLEKLEKKFLDDYYGRGFRLFGPSTAKRIQISEKLKQIETEKKYLLAKLKRAYT